MLRISTTIQSRLFLAAALFILASWLMSTAAFAQIAIKDNLITFGQEEIEFQPLIEAMAEFCKINIVIPDNVKPNGKVFVLAPDGMTCEEAWPAFLQIIQSLGLTFSDVGKYSRYSSIKELDKQATKVYIQKVEVSGKNEPAVTLLYRLKHLEADELKKALDPLRSQDGKILTLNNLVVIIDHMESVQRLARMIRELDTGSGNSKIYYWTAMHSSIEDIVQLTEKLFMQGKKGSSQAVGLDKLVADERTNGMFIIGTEEACKRVIAFVPKIDIDILRTSEMEVVFLQFAQAEELSSTIQSVVSQTKAKTSKQKSFGEDLEVKVTADKQTNSLVLIGPPRGIEELKRLISKLDQFPRQVFLEVVILEVALSDTDIKGVATTVATDIPGVDGGVMFTGANYSSLNSLAINPATLTGLALGTQVGEVEGSDKAFNLGLTFPKFSALLRLMQMASKVNVVANPYLMGMDTEEAEIIVGSNVPYITGSSRDSFNQPVLSIQRQDVALTIKMQPEINESYRVKLKLEVSIEDLTSVSETLGPTTSKRAIKTVAFADNGSRIAIGGLLKDKEIQDDEKVPFLGDIPIIGRLFRSSGVRTEKVNLMAVITPHVIETQEDLKRIFKEKLEERSAYIQEMYGEENTDYAVTDDYHDRVGIIEQIHQIVEEERVAADSGRVERVLVITPDSVESVPADDVEYDPEESPETP